MTDFRAERLSQNGCYDMLCYVMLLLLSRYLLSSLQEHNMTDVPRGTSVIERLLSCDHVWGPRSAFICGH